ncbi:MAG: DUF3822 family protein, partial [Ferruginibacter sp.]
MKPTFNILPEKDEREQNHLLVEAGSCSISFIWFRKDPVIIRGLAVYNFTNKMIPGEISEALQNVMRSNSIFNDPNMGVTVAYDFSESILIPEAYYSQALSVGMLQVVHPVDDSYDIKTDHVKQHNCFNVYAV